MRNINTVYSIVCHSPLPLCAVRLVTIEMCPCTTIGNYPHNGTKMVAPLVIGATNQLLFV